MSLFFLRETHTKSKPTLPTIQIQKHLRK